MDRRLITGWLWNPSFHMYSILQLIKYTKQQCHVLFVYRFQCHFAVIPAHLEAGKPDAQENLSAALTAYHAQKER